MTTHAFTFRCSVRSSGADAPRVLAPPPLVYAVALAAGVGLQAALGGLDRPGLAGRLAAYVLLLAGGALAVSFVRAFRRHRTSIDFGTATTLVTGGAYRVSRNPGYVGMALVYAGLAVLAGAWWAFATLVPALVVVDRCVIRGEERHLEQRFGAAYDDYRRRTRRWL